MKYKVVHNFRDLRDHGYLYRVGDTYPRPGVAVNEARAAQLLTGANKAKLVLIEEVVEEKPVEEKPKKKKTTAKKKAAPKTAKE